MMNTMIFLVLTSDKVYNDTLQLEALSLTRERHTYTDTLRFINGPVPRKGEIVDSLQSDKPLSRLRFGETLYVVGHGAKDSLTLSELDPKQLLNHLLASGLKPFLKNLDIVLVSCHAGNKENNLERSFAETFYDLLLDTIPEIEVHHREKEGSLPSVKAPKHIIGFREYDGKAVGIKSIHYETYAKEKKSNTLDTWLPKHTNLLREDDFQIIGSKLI